MSEVVLMTLSEMSFAGAVMIIVITVIRAIAINKLPKKTFIILWEVALLRLMMPISLPSVTSVYTLIEMNKSPQMQNSVATYFPISDVVANGTYLPQAVITEKAALPLENIIWLSGMAIMLIIFLILYAVAFSKFRFAEAVKDGYAVQWLNQQKLRRKVKICLCAGVSSPLTYGIIRPVILLPKNTDMTDHENLNYILMHELTHIKRLDMLRKFAAIAVLCIHWFNPAVWVMYLLFNRDIEVACDEAVIMKMNGDCRSAYAQALLNMEAAHDSLSSLYSNFSRNATHERIVAIMKTQKLSIMAIIAACTIIVGTASTLATSAAQVPHKHVEHVAEDAVLISNGESGEALYSLDGGKTFVNKEQLGIDIPDVEWWTAEEYAEWLENEKKNLACIIGERCWTSGTGWFTWTQEKVDETIAMYEGILEQIKHGCKISKSVDGCEDVMLAHCPDDIFNISEHEILTCDEDAVKSSQVHCVEGTAISHVYVEDNAHLGNVAVSSKYNRHHSDDNHCDSSHGSASCDDCQHKH